ncbi:MAG: nucleoside hydrolase [Fidelibacterota bacterium]|nr:MAG: nucleoside hydrolase [Candidatus Neomarinimicrobiota bacterium]
MKGLALFALVFGFSIITLSGVDKQKIIFDCDLGGDIDDAFAVSLVLTSPEFEVLGIVLDQGNTPKRAQVACKMLYETGRDDIPVVVGRKTDDYISHQFKWAEGFTKLKPVRKPAADFIIENLKKYPNEVILFTVGPVPNIKDVIEKDPDVLKLAKHVYSMFGSFYLGYDSNPVPSAEWNVRADVSASKAFTSSGAPVTYAGLDITTFVKLGEELRQQLWQYDSPLTNALEDLYGLWRNEWYARPDPTLFDVVAVGMVLWPELFETRKAFVKVIDPGYTIIDESREPNCEIGMSIQKDEFLRRVVDRYLKQNLHRK